jgi:flagellar protein FlbD
MIQLTRINHTSFILNSDLIENVQATPDTVITLTNGHNYMVLEPPAEVIERIVGYRRRIVQLHDAPSNNAAGEGCERNGE